jgi:hypothetical protein
MVLVPLVLLGGTALAISIALKGKNAAGTAATEGALFDMRTPANLMEVKRALRVANSNLPAAELTSPVWSPACSGAFREFLAGLLALSTKGTTPAQSAAIAQKIATYRATIGKEDVPTAPGLAALAQYATTQYDPKAIQNGIAYMQKWWPKLYAFAMTVGKGAPARVIAPTIGANAKAAA